ncbi:von Willebrand factor A domain-containing protein 2-like [Hemiscyllium ocellatum]|uniref:von Willebrand factor A domain-containing protein 2-like n=1 Tax=Hemiscyllium ocellatum TaxID=170820 RepID=UPI0029661138|nr:von Willebrand factor A domain-containing protein 2-like [Hemiscyllium ocellatum]
MTEEFISQAQGNSDGMNLGMRSINGSLCSVLSLTILVSQSCGLQQLMADKETIVKILSSGKLIQCSAAMDILLLMDGSYSIGKGSFERSKHFAAKLCDILDINPDRIRIGVIQFSSKPKVEFGLGTYPTRQETKEAIKKIFFRGGGTEIGAAVKYVLHKGFHGGRQGVLKVIVILTDGKSQDNATVPLRFAKNSGMTVFAVGVKHPGWKELASLASMPSEMHVFYAAHYNDAVNGLYTTLTQSTVCSDVHPACKVVSQFCQRTTVNAEKKYLGRHICWKGNIDGLKGHGKPMATFCPSYTWKRTYSQIQTRCIRTLCPDPCDSGPCRNGGTCVSETVDEYSCLCPLGYGGDKHCTGNRYLRPAGIMDCSVNLMFLVDGSWNMGLEGFLQAKAFIKRFLRSILSSSARLLVGFAQYSDNVCIEIGLGQYSDFNNLLKAIDSISFNGGKTFTGKALQYVAENGFSEDSRTNVPHVLVVFSNSKSHDSVLLAAQHTKEKEIFILSIGKKYIKNQLNHIAGDSQLAFAYNEPQELYSKVLELRTKICGFNMPGCFSKSLDLVFTVDASGQVGRQNFRQIKGFVRSIVSHFDIDRDLTQVAMVIYSNKPRTLFNLDSFDSEGKIKRAISSGPFLDGSAHTGKALKYILEDTLSIKKGARPGIHKVVVVITNGQSSDDIVPNAEKLRRNGITIIALGMVDSQATALLRVAGSHRLVIPVRSYKNLKHYEVKLVRKICEGGSSAYRSHIDFVLLNTV